MNAETVTVVPLTVENLPSGLLWEGDGACWQAKRLAVSVMPGGWRWVPKNFLAFAKGFPTGEMHDFPPDTTLRGVVPCS